MHCTYMATFETQVADGRGGHRWEVWGQKMNIVIIKYALKLLQGQKCPPSHGIKEPKAKTSSRNLKTIQLFWGRSK